MNVLLTGAFGNLGTSTLRELVNAGHHVRCFDLPTRANQTAASAHRRAYGDKMDVVWGDLRHPEDVAAAVNGQDVVVHMAFIIPKLSSTGIESESRPDWAREINVGGTTNLIAAMKALAQPPKLLFTSSYHVFGLTQDQPPPRTVWDPVQPLEHYAHHKVECERLVRTSGLEWCIFRLSAAFPFALKLDPAMFDIPLDNRMEFVHSRDVGLAIANAVSHPDVWRRILLIGGGARCQYFYREIVERILNASGVGMLPPEAFNQTPFATDWVDTSESQRLLNYQHRDLGDYILEMKAVLGPRRWFIGVARPLAQRMLLSKSIFYKRAHGGQRVPEPTHPANTPTAAPMLELTPEVVTLLVETARQLRGKAQRLFIARAVKALGSDGAQKAERELGWPKHVIADGLREMGA
ncbi:MAG TPA: NAD(P)-dependent oxidoreductase [Anaerolineae bacterium]|jgi:nucleoside-diphosphate-sugar epimerase